MRGRRWLYFPGFLQSIIPVKSCICNYFSACCSVFVRHNLLYLTHWHHGLGLAEAEMVSVLVEYAELSGVHLQH